jgi:hypothetical protein
VLLSSRGEVVIDGRSGGTSLMNVTQRNALMITPITKLSPARSTRLAWVLGNGIRKSLT